MINTIMNFTWIYKIIDILNINSNDKVLAEANRLMKLTNITTVVSIHESSIFNKDSSFDKEYINTMGNTEECYKKDVFLPIKSKLSYYKTDFWKYSWVTVVIWDTSYSYVYDYEHNEIIIKKCINLKTNETIYTKNHIEEHKEKLVYLYLNK